MEDWEGCREMLPSGMTLLGLLWSHSGYRNLYPWTLQISIMERGSAHEAPLHFLRSEGLLVDAGGAM